MTRRLTRGGSPVYVLLLFTTTCICTRVVTVTVIIVVVVVVVVVEPSRIHIPRIPGHTGRDLTEI